MSEREKTRKGDGPTNEQPLTAGQLIPSNLPVPVPAVQPRKARRRWIRIAVLLAVLIGGAIGGFYWWKVSQTALPPCIASGNGRLEADEIDIQTKFAGRIADLFADEGDLVTAGQVVARMDTRDLEASLKKAQSSVRQAQKSLDEARAFVVVLNTQVSLA